MVIDRWNYSLERGYSLTLRLFMLSALSRDRLWSGTKISNVQSSRRLGLSFAQSLRLSPFIAASGLFFMTQDKPAKKMTSFKVCRPLLVRVISDCGSD